jgi:hypothetical protein
MIERTRGVASLLTPSGGRHTRSRSKVRLRPIQAIVAVLVLAGGLTTAFVSASGANADQSGHSSDGNFGYGHRHHPMITTSSSTTDPGGSLSVNCQNFAPNEKITLTLHSGGVFLGKTHSNKNGSCSIEVIIPSDTTAGVHTIVATGATGDSASTEITVVIKHHHHHHH